MRWLCLVATAGALAPENSDAGTRLLALLTTDPGRVEAMVKGIKRSPPPQCTLIPNEDKRLIIRFSYPAAGIVREKLVYEALHGELSDLVGRAHPIPVGIDPMCETQCTIVDMPTGIPLSLLYIFRRNRDRSRVGVAVSERKLAAITAAAIRGLERLHQSGIAHGKLVPSNIFVNDHDDDESVVVRLTDLTGALPCRKEEPCARADLKALANAILHVFGGALCVRPPELPMGSPCVWTPGIAESPVFFNFLNALDDRSQEAAVDYGYWVSEFDRYSHSTMAAEDGPPSAAAGLEPIRVEFAAKFEAGLTNEILSMVGTVKEDDPLPCPPRTLELASFPGETISFSHPAVTIVGRGSSIYIVPLTGSPTPQIHAAVRVANSAENVEGTMREKAFRKFADPDVLSDITTPFFEIDDSNPDLLSLRCAARITVTGMGGRAIEPTETYPEATVAAMAVRMIAILEKIHSMGFFHGDVHSGNFLVPTDGRIDGIKIIDFERTGTFVNPQTGSHDPHVVLPSVPLVNKALLSPFELEGSDLSRRDDMYRLSELLLELSISTSFTTGSTEDRRLIATKKRAWRIDNSFDPVFNEFHTEMSHLEFAQRPNYEKWTERFSALAARTP